MPRPRKLTPDLAAWLVGRVAAGWERDDLFRTGRVSPRSLARWLEAGRNGDPDYRQFAEAFDRARRSVLNERARDRSYRGFIRWKEWCRVRGLDMGYWRNDTFYPAVPGMEENRPPRKPRSSPKINPAEALILLAKLLGPRKPV